MVVTKIGHLRYTIKDIVVIESDIDLSDKNSIKMFAGDVNGDGIIGIADLGMVQNNRRKDPSEATEAYVRNSDLTGDGIIDYKDENVISSNYGKQNADDPYYDNSLFYYKH